MNDVICQFSELHFEWPTKQRLKFNSILSLSFRFMQEKSKVKLSVKWIYWIFNWPIWDKIIVAKNDDGRSVSFYSLSFSFQSIQKLDKIRMNGTEKESNRMKKKKKNQLNILFLSNEYFIGVRSKWIRLLLQKLTK